MSSFIDTSTDLTPKRKTTTCCVQTFQLQYHVCAYLVGARNEPAEAQEKKLKVADILSRNVNAFKKLSVYVEPVLGM